MLINKPQWQAPLPQTQVAVFTDPCAPSASSDTRLLAHTSSVSLSALKSKSGLSIAFLTIFRALSLAFRLHWVFGHLFLPALSLGQTHLSSEKSSNCFTPPCDTPAPPYISSVLGLLCGKAGTLLMQSQCLLCPILISPLKPRSGPAPSIEVSLVGLQQGNLPSLDLSTLDLSRHL